MAFSTWEINYGLISLNFLFDVFFVEREETKNLKLKTTRTDRFYKFYKFVRFPACSHRLALGIEKA